jgi:hypothetical protein
MKVELNMYTGKRAFTPLTEPPHRQAQEREDKQVSAEAIFPRQAS